jgi:hypothetical protein
VNQTYGVPSSWMLFCNVYILYPFCVCLRAARCNGCESLASVISGIGLQMLDFQISNLKP